MSSLMEKMKNANKSIAASVLSESASFAKKSVTQTELPILNVAFSGDVDGGIVSGVTILSGEPATFKSLLGLYCLKSYLDKYADAIAIFWDSEGGITPEYLKMNGIDPNRVLHIPLEHLEQMKFDMVKRINEISRGDKVFLFVDSLGALGSKKELDDAVDEKSVADMTRAKVIRSILRLITPMVLNKDLPCIIINHIYKNITAMYGGNIQGGGTAVGYFANSIYEITKSQEKDGDDLIGWQFTINIAKSRYVKSKAKLPFTVTFEEGIFKWSGLFDLALDGNFVVKAKQGWYNIVDLNSGEISEKNYRRSDIESNNEFMNNLISDTRFKEFVANQYKLGSAMGKLEEDDVFNDNEGEDE